MVPRRLASPRLAWPPPPPPHTHTPRTPAPPCRHNIKQCGEAWGGEGWRGGAQTNAGEQQVCLCPYQQAPISLTNR